MKTLSPLFLFALLMAGCGPTVIPFAASPEIARSYTIDHPMTASVGDTMLSVRSISSAPVYVVMHDYTPPQHDAWKGGLDYPPLTKGMRFTKVADRSDGLIGIHGRDYRITVPGSLTRDDRKEEITIWIEPSGVVSETMEGRPWTRDPIFTEEERTEGSSYTGELLYMGRDGTTITMSFRESGHGSQPAATTVRHNLDEGPTFTFRDITINVLKATDAGIEFRVVSDDGLAWAR